jgi:putative transposase
MELAECRWGDDQRPFGGEAIGPNPPDRGTRGTKRSLLTDGQGIPIAVVVAGAKRHDMTLLAGTLDTIVVVRPEPTEEAPQPLCADKGDADEACYQAAEGHD